MYQPARFPPVIFSDTIDFDLTGSAAISRRLSTTMIRALSLTFLLVRPGIVLAQDTSLIEHSGRRTDAIQVTHLPVANLQDHGTTPQTKTNFAWLDTDVARRGGASLDPVQAAGPGPLVMPTDGVTDCSPIINAAILALPPGGGTVQLPAGDYQIKSPLLLGDGTPTVASTRSGIILRGSGNPGAPPGLGAGYSVPRGTRLFWGGSGSSDGMVRVRGPLAGWSIENLFLDGQNLQSIGVLILSAQFGTTQSTAYAGFTSAAIYSTAYPAGGYNQTIWNTDSLHNSFRDTVIVVPEVTGAKGIVLTGIQSNNTDYSDFTNTSIRMAAKVENYGIYLQGTDSCQFRNTHFFGEGPLGTPVVFDYTMADSWPASCQFYGIDTGGARVGFANRGLPGPAQRQNMIYGLVETNGAVVTDLPGLVNMFPQTTRHVSRLANAAAITPTLGYTVFQSGMFRVSIYLVVTGGDATVGTITPSVTWNDGTAARTASAPAAPATPGSTSQTTFICHSLPSAMNYQTLFTAVVGAPRYDLFITIERLT